MRPAYKCRTYLWLVPALLIVALIAAGCAGTVPAAVPTAASMQGTNPTTVPAATSVPATTAPQSASGVLVYAAGSEAAGLDPHVVLSGQGLRVFQNVYEALGRHRAGEKQIEAPIEPALAESWTKSDDGLTYTFKLRSGVKFHDGTDFDAEAVKVNLERIRTLNLGPASFFTAVDTVNVVDKSTVEVKLKTPNPLFEQYLPFTFMISPTAIKKNTEGDDHATKWLSTHAVGTGPYTVESWDKGQQLVLAAFPDYWGGWQGAHIQRIVMRVVPEAATQRLMLENGDAQMIDSVVASDVTDLSGKAGVQVVQSKGLRVDLLAMNQNYAPLADPNVRQAIQYAFPYDEVIHVAYNGLAVPAIGPLSVDMPGSAKGTLEPLKQDLAKAKELLGQSKFPNGGFNLRLVYSPNLTEQKTAGLLLAEALKPFNITVDVQAMPFAQMIQAFGTYDEATSPHLAFLRASPVTADPVLVLKQFLHSNFAGKLWNWSYYRNPEVDKLLDQAQGESNEAKRNELTAQAQKMAFDDAAYVFALEAVEADGLRDNLKGFKFNPFNYSWDVYFYDLQLQ